MQVSQLRPQYRKVGVEAGPVVACASVIHNRENVNGGDQRAIVPPHESVGQRDPLVQVDVLEEEGIDENAQSAERTPTVSPVCSGCVRSVFSIYLLPRFARFAL